MLGEAVADLLDNSVCIGDSAGRVFVRIYDTAAERHFKDTSVSSLQFSFDAKRLLDCSRQTGGLRMEISFNAVGDLQLFRSTQVAPPLTGHSPCCDQLEESTTGPRQSQEARLTLHLRQVFPV